MKRIRYWLAELRKRRRYKRFVARWLSDHRTWAPTRQKYKALDRDARRFMEEWNE